MDNIDWDGILNGKYGVTTGQTININGNYYKIQVPEKIDKNTSVYIVGNGANGFQNDGIFTFRRGKNSNVVLISPIDAVNVKSFLNVGETVSLISSKLGIEKEPIFSSYSSSGPLMFEAAQKYIQDKSKPVLMVMNDPSALGGSDADINYSNFKDSVLVAFTDSSGGAAHSSKFDERLVKAAKAGAKVVFVRNSNYLNSGGHNDTLAITDQLGVYDFDNFEFKDKFRYIPKAEGYSVDATFKYQWLDENGILHDFDNAAEAQAYVNSAREGLPTDNVSIEDLYTESEELSEFAASYKGDGDTLASNLSYVSNAMSELKGKIQKHDDLAYEKETDRDANIIGSLYSATNYYGNITNELYAKVSEEADAVYAIANEIYKMDGFASFMADNALSDGVSGLYSTSNPTVASALETLNNTTASLFDTAKNAFITSDKYNELSNLLGNKVGAGEVGRISVDSLNNAINSIIPSLNGEIDRANSLKSSVIDFTSKIGTSSILQGGVWENVKINMQNYQNLLTLNADSAQFLGDTIQTAMGMVTDYIQGASASINATIGTKYSAMATIGELDDSKLPEVINSIAEMVETIATQERTIQSMESAPPICEIPDVEETCKPAYTQAEINAAKEKLEGYKQIKETLETYKGILEGFSKVVSAAQNLIQKSIDQVKAAYEKPVDLTQSNESFATNFVLDLDPYKEFLSSTDPTYYKNLLNDYQSKLNNNDTEGLENPYTDTTAGNADTESNNNGSGSGNGNNGYTPGGNTSGTGGGSTPTPESKTEVPTDASTEMPTEEPTELPTESLTEELTEIDTELLTEELTEMETELSTESDTTYGGGIEQKPDNNYVEVPTEEIYINPIGEEKPVETINQEPTVNEYVETEMINNIMENKVEEVPNVAPSEQEPDNKGMKTMGIATGLSFAVGATALGAYTILKKQEEESDLDYKK